MVHEVGIMSCVGPGAWCVGESVRGDSTCAMALCRVVFSNAWSSCGVLLHFLALFGLVELGHAVQLTMSRNGRLPHDELA